MQFRKVCPIQDSTVHTKNIWTFRHSRKPSGLLSNMTPCNAQCAQQNLHKIEKLYLHRATDAHSDLTRPVLIITQCYSTHMMTHTQPRKLPKPSTLQQPLRRRFASQSVPVCAPSRCQMFVNVTSLVWFPLPTMHRPCGILWVILYKKVNTMWNSWSLVRVFGAGNVNTAETALQCTS